MTKIPLYSQASESSPTVLPLEVIVMSATLDADKFSSYFRGAPVLYVSGRQHAVYVRHAAEAQEDWIRATLRTVFDIHERAPQG